MKAYLNTVNLILILLHFSSCSNSVDKSISAEITYEKMETATIGDQTWTATNLNVSHFRNGDPIPEAKTDEEWVSAGRAGKPVWCYYENDTTNGKRFGKLYNWFAVNDIRKLAPKGFHIPNIDEWSILFKILGDGIFAGDKMRDSSITKIKVTPNTGKSGFRALPAGFRYDPSFFWAFGDVATWWTASSFDSNDSWYTDLDFNIIHTVSKGHCPKLWGFSVRCVLDPTIQSLKPSHSKGSDSYRNTDLK